jgi:hypothetical protein
MIITATIIGLTTLLFIAAELRHKAKVRVRTQKYLKYMRKVNQKRQ